MVNPRSLGTLGIGFGALAIATLGLIVAPVAQTQAPSGYTLAPRTQEKRRYDDAQSIADAALAGLVATADSVAGAELPRSPVALQLFADGGSGTNDHATGVIEYVSGTDLLAGNQAVFDVALTSADLRASTDLRGFENPVGLGAQNDEALLLILLAAEL